jgi:hypothetical protein
MPQRACRVLIEKKSPEVENIDAAKAGGGENEIMANARRHAQRLKYGEAVTSLSPVLVSPEQTPARKRVAQNEGPFLHRLRAEGLVLATPATRRFGAGPAITTRTVSCQTCTARLNAALTSNCSPEAPNALAPSAGLA